MIDGTLRSAVLGDLGHRTVKFKREYICEAAQCNLVQPGVPAHLNGRQPAWPAGQQQALLERLRAYEAACRAARKKTAAPQDLYDGGVGCRQGAARDHLVEAATAKQARP